MKTVQLTLFIAALLLGLQTRAQSPDEILVDASGQGQFTTIGAAIESLPQPNFKRVVIRVKAGTYQEKIRINRDFVTLKGEGKTKTILQFNQLKKDWVKNKDYEGPAVVNIDANDIILADMTIKNSYPEIGPTAYVLYGTGTRTIINNCELIGNGANSVSLMNYTDGMYYLKNCRIEGTVDCMRAMGWCQLEACEVFQKEAISSLWHAGINNPNQKMVITNTQFDGVEHFFLGRHHYDAQFFLVNCQFDEKLADLPIYRKCYPKAPEKERPYVYGDRHYYLNCQQQGTDYPWLADNMNEFDAKLKAADFTPNFTFDGQWTPEQSQALKAIKISEKDGLIYLELNYPVTVMGDLVLNIDGTPVKFEKGQGRKILTFHAPTKQLKLNGKPDLSIGSGQLIPCEATLATPPTTDQISW